MTEPRPTLPRPLRRLLEDRSDPQQQARIWRRVAEGRGTARRPTQYWLRPALALAVVAAVLAWRWTAAPRTESAEPVALVPDPSPRAHEAPGVARPTDPTVAPGSIPPARFPAGIQRVAPDTVLAVLANEPDRVALRLDQGRVALELEDTPQQHWTLDAGWARLSFSGARVQVDRDRQRLVVALERGALELEGPGVPGGRQRWQAPRSLTLEAPGEADANAPGMAPASLGGLQPRAEAAGALPGAAGPSPTVGKAVRPTPAPIPPASDGEAASRPAASAPPSADRLLAEADDAQARRDYGIAAERFQQFLELYPQDPRSALAAFSLGRVELDALDRPAQAARSFGRAFALGLPTALEEDGLARLATAHRRSGNPAAAEEVEASYRRRFPAGQRLESLGPGAPRR